MLSRLCTGPRALYSAIDPRKSSAPPVDRAASLDFVSRAIIAIASLFGLGSKAEDLIFACKSFTGDQDFSQRYSLFWAVPSEIAKMSGACLLLIVTPQQCGDDGAVCTTQQNWHRVLDLANADNLYRLAVISNASALAILFILYIVEIWRENILIEFLEVNKALPADDDSVTKRLKKLNPANREQVLGADSLYKTCSIYAYYVYLFNAILSSLALFESSLGSQTWSSFLALVYLQKGRLEKCYNIAHSKAFFSAYLSDKVCFNDVDHDHDVTIVGHDTDVGDIGMVKKAKEVLTAITDA